MKILKTMVSLTLIATAVQPLYAAPDETAAETNRGGARPDRPGGGGGGGNGGGGARPGRPGGGGGGGNGGGGARPGRPGNPGRPGGPGHVHGPSKPVRPVKPWRPSRPVRPIIINEGNNIYYGGHDWDDSYYSGTASCSPEATKKTAVVVEEKIMALLEAERFQDAHKLQQTFDKIRALKEPGAKIANSLKLVGIDYKSKAALMAFASVRWDAKSIQDPKWSGQVYVDNAHIDLELPADESGAALALELARTMHEAYVSSINTK